MSVIKKIADSIADKVEDFSEINVHTYSGTLEITPGNNPDPDKILKNAFDGAVTDPKSKIKLVASTTIKIDGDINEFFSSQGLNPNLEAAHQAAVESSKQYRQAILNIATGLVKGS